MKRSFPCSIWILLYFPFDIVRAALICDNGLSHSRIFDTKLSFSVKNILLYLIWKELQKHRCSNLVFPYAICFFDLIWFSCNIDHDIKSGLYQFYSVVPRKWLELQSVCGLFSWWRHQMEPFSALLALCEGKSLVSGEFPSQRPVTRSFDVFFDLCLNKRLSKPSWGWWFETPSTLNMTSL